MVSKTLGLIPKKSTLNRVCKRILLGKNKTQRVNRRELYLVQVLSAAVQIVNGIDDYIGHNAIRIEKNGIRLTFNWRLL